MRETSIEAWESVRQHLGLRHQTVYAELYDRGPMTGRELSTHGKIDGGWKRLHELRDLGLVKECGTRPCGVTGRRSIVWDVSGNPVSLDVLTMVRRKPKLRRLQQRIDEQQQRIGELELEVSRLRRLGQIEMFE